MELNWLDQGLMTRQHNSCMSRGGLNEPELYPVLFKNAQQFIYFFFNVHNIRHHTAAQLCKSFILKTNIWTETGMIFIEN